MREYGLGVAVAFLMGVADDLTAGEAGGAMLALKFKLREKWRAGVGGAGSRRRGDAGRASELRDVGFDGLGGRAPGPIDCEKLDRMVVEAAEGLDLGGCILA